MGRQAGTRAFGRDQLRGQVWLPPATLGKGAVTNGHLVPLPAALGGRGPTPCPPLASSHKAWEQSWLKPRQGQEERSRPSPAPSRPGARVPRVLAPARQECACCVLHQALPGEQQGCASHSRCHQPPCSRWARPGRGQGAKSQCPPRPGRLGREGASSIPGGIHAGTPGATHPQLPWHGRPLSPGDWEARGQLVTRSLESSSAPGAGKDPGEPRSWWQGAGLCRRGQPEFDSQEGLP